MHITREAEIVGLKRDIAAAREEIERLEAEKAKAMGAPEAEPKARQGTVLNEASKRQSFEETSYLEGVPGLAEDIKDGMTTPLEDCVGQQDLEW